MVTAEKTAEAFEEAGIIKTIVPFEGLEYNFGEADGLLSQEVKERYEALENELYEKYPNRKERWNYTVFPVSRP